MSAGVSSLLSPGSAEEDYASPCCSEVQLGRAVSTSMVFLAISTFTRSRVSALLQRFCTQTVCLPVASELLAEALAKPASFAEYPVLTQPVLRKSEVGSSQFDLQRYHHAPPSGA